MSDDFKPFLTWSYPYEVLRDRCGLIEQLLDYIVRGASDDYTGKIPEAAVQLGNSIRAIAYSSFQSLILKRPKSLVVDSGDTNELVLTAIDKCRFYAGVNQLRVAPLVSNNDFLEAFEKRFNAQKLYFDQKDPSVDGAYEAARINLWHAETRLVLLHSLYELLKRTPHDRIQHDGFDRIRTILFGKRERFLRTMATFGILKGGEALTEVGKLLANASCHKDKAEDGCDFSIMHFLTFDGVSLGHWKSADEKKFRADIAAKYKELK